MTITATPNLSYGDGYFCLGEANPSPANAMGTGTFRDLDSTGPGNNAVANRTTGLLALHSGWAGTTHRIEFKNAYGCARDTAFVRLKAMSSPTITYSAPTFCKSTTTIPPPTVSIGNLGGSFAVTPALSGFNTVTGGVSVGAATTAGTYNVTYTPNADSCGYAATTQLQIINLDSAIFNYAPVYCHGSPVDGYPLTITSLPTAGGNFLCDPLTPGLVVDPVTGALDLVNSPPDTFYVNYVPTSTCRVSKSDTLIVRDPFRADFTVPTGLCANSGLASCVLTFPGSGTFVSPSGDVYFANDTLGVINTDSCNVGGPFVIYRNNGDAVCPDTFQRHVSIQYSSPTVFNYGATAFCKNAPNPFPIYVSGNTGGTFAISPGAAIDSVTGEILLSQCNYGTFSVTYTSGGATCPTVSTLNGIKVDSVPDASFNFVPNDLCQNSGTYVVTAPPSLGIDTWGMFQSNGVPMPAAMTGNTINTATMPAGGPFYIKRTSVINACRDTFLDFVRILAEEDASFAYVPDTFCRADQDPVPSIIGNGGGVFSNGGVSNLVFLDLLVGRIDLGLSGTGSHIVKYKTGGACPDSATASIYIKDALNPFFSYTAYEFCETETDTLIADYDTIFVPGSFSFSSVPATPALNTQTGNFDLSAVVTPDTFTITMSLVNGQGACVSTFDRLIYVYQSNPDPTDSLAFRGNNSYCLTEDTVRGHLYGIDRVGRFFSSPPTLVWQNRDSGIVNISASPEGHYTVYFIKTNACQDSLQDTINLRAPTNPTMVYKGGPSGGINDFFCKSDTNNPFPVLTPPTSGTFTATSLLSGNVLTFVSNATGVIDLANTDPGTYDIKFQELSGCAGSGIKRIRINAGPTINLFVEPQDVFCSGDTISLRVSGGSDYTISVNGIKVDSSQTHVTTTLADSDYVETTVADRFGCLATKGKVVKVWPVPTGLVVAEPGTIAGADSIHIYMGTTVANTKFYWTAERAGSVTLGKYADSTITIDPAETASIDVRDTLLSSFTPGKATFYIVPRAEICYGDTVEVVVKINPSQTAIFIPEVFTPDDSRINDTWQIQWRADIHKEDYEIFVYNRSGGQVHWMPELTDQWDGDSLPDGVYWYVLQEKTTRSVLYKGAVTIRRH